MTAPVQRPASTSDARKRAEETVTDGPYPVSADIWAEVIREACAAAWEEGWLAPDDSTRHDNPYRSTS